MVARQDLYDAFGELIYAICMADGRLTETEVKTYTDLLVGYKGAKDVQWSFDYSHAKGISVDTAFEKGIAVCKQNGPDPEYTKIIEVLDAVSVADGIDVSERELINRFISELKEKFIADHDKEQGFS